MIELRTKDIEVSKINPFEHDLLKRDKDINHLTQIVKNTGGGFTLSVNADWGYGKTTFVKMWDVTLQNEGYKTIYFNAWESDFVADPMMALIDGLRDGFDGKDLPQEKLQRLSALLDAIIEIVKMLPTPNASIIGSFGFIFKGWVSKLLIDKNKLQEHQSGKKIVVDFKKQLAEFAKEIDGEKQLIIFVDELDRCRPDYAVQMLERIKHFFSIDNIIFVLSMDKNVMCKSIRAVYGGLEIDTEAYLRRFVDLEFDLPEQNISDLIDAQFERKGLSEYFNGYWDYLSKHYSGEDRVFSLNQAIKDCLLAERNSLRDIEKYFNRLGVVVTSKDLTHKELDVACYVLYLYMFHRELYKHIRQIDLDIPEMWGKIKEQLSSITIDSTSEHYRRYMGMVIGTFGTYIDLKEQKGGYRHEILNENPEMEWFPKEYKEWLRRAISNHRGELLSHLCEHIELLHETFNWGTAE